MIAAAVLAVLFVPVFYVAVQYRFVRRSLSPAAHAPNGPEHQPIATAAR